MPFPPLAGQLYWIDAGALRLTPAPQVPAATTAWDYAQVTASRDAFAAFLLAAQAAGLDQSVFDQIRREQQLFPFTP